MLVNTHTDKDVSALPVIPFQEQLGREIRKCRKSQGLNQTDLANLAGTSQSALALIEAGKGNPTFHTIDRILHTLGKRASIRLMPALQQSVEPEPDPKPQA